MRVLKIPGKNKEAGATALLNILYLEHAPVYFFFNCLNTCGCLWLWGDGWVEVRRGRSSGLIPVIPAWFNSDTPESSLHLKCIAFYCFNVFYPLFKNMTGFSKWVWKLQTRTSVWRNYQMAIVSGNLFLKQLFTGFSILIIPQVASELSGWCILRSFCV